MASPENNPPEVPPPGPKKPEHPQPPAPTPPHPPFRAPDEERYRWVFFLFVFAVLVGALYLGYRIIRAWLRLMGVIEEEEKKDLKE